MEKRGRDDFRHEAALLRPEEASGEGDAITLETGRTIVALGFTFNPLPAFQPGETVLHFEKRLWALSCMSPPTYRLFFSLPPLTEAAMYVTDRRVVLIDSVLRWLTQEFSIWFAPESHQPARELFKAASLGSGRWSGNYLELISEDPQRHWYRSRELRLRFFMRDPGVLERLISGTALRSRQAPFTGLAL
jgi:hypothetical protein